MSSAFDSHWNKRSHLPGPALVVVLLVGACASAPLAPGDGIQPPVETGAGMVSHGAEPEGLVPHRPVEPKELRGQATWYGERHHGRTTANGEEFDMHAYTAAHRTLPFNTVVRVVDTDTKKSVVVRINDRGPKKRRLVIDLSRAAAEEIGILRCGVTDVELEVLAWGNGARHFHGRTTMPKWAREQLADRKRQRGSRRSDNATAASRDQP